MWTSRRSVIKKFVRVTKNVGHKSDDLTIVSLGLLSLKDYDKNCPFHRQPAAMKARTFLM